jgi:6-phosphogluconolactonase
MRLNLSTGVDNMALLEERFFESMDTCAHAVADSIANDLISAIDKRGFASLAVSGGRTPETVFPILAARDDVNWEKIRVTLTDERWVPPDHPDSNEKLVRTYLFKGNVTAASFVGMKTPDDTSEGGLDACQENIRRLPMPLDTVYLGMGLDGHIASLFPGSKALSQVSGLCAATVSADGRFRMSLSPEALLSARHLILMISGVEKRTVYGAAKSPGSITDLPVRLLLQQSRVPITVFMS